MPPPTPLLPGIYLVEVQIDVTGKTSIVELQWLPTHVWVDMKGNPWHEKYWKILSYSKK